MQLLYTDGIISNKKKKMDRKGDWTTKLSSTESCGYRKERSLYSLDSGWY